MRNYTFECYKAYLTNNQSFRTTENFHDISDNPTHNKCSSFLFERSNYRNTLSEEWNLNCENPFWRSNMQTIYFFGIFLSPFVLKFISKKYL